MQQIPGLIFCLAYVLELILIQCLPALASSAIGLAITFAMEWSGRRWWSGRWPRQLGVIAAVAVIVASCNYQLRLPQPSAQDISQFIPALESQTVVVRGDVAELPRLTRSGQMRLLLDVTGLDAGDLNSRLSQSPDQVRGKLYVTIPQALGVDLYPGLPIAVTGNLYQPQAAKNPDGFDFQAFLARQGCFAGLRGETVQWLSSQKPRWGLWQIQRRIVRSQAAQLPYPEGALVSAMVLGGSVVDLPATLKDQFAQIGLSHVLAASGFQISLILGVVLALTKLLPKVLQVLLGSLALLVFLGLSGGQPAVLRAVIMGWAVLLGLALERQVNPLGSLVLAVTLLLVAQPHWIADLGLQLSFLATLGLLVMVPQLSRGLDWLPTALIPLLTVPLAAFFWTLPLQLHNFGVVSPYTLPANLLTTPLISIISLGGVVSAGVAVIFPIAGSATAALLHYPTAGLIAIVEWLAQLPGSVMAVGTIPLWLMGLLYLMLMGLWWRPSWQRHGWVVGLAGAALVFLPAWVLQTNLVQITALATSDQPVLIVQNRGQVGLVNSGRERTTQLTVLPFLRQQGVNRIDWALSLTKSPPAENGWDILRQHLPLRSLYHVSRETQTDRSQAFGPGHHFQRGSTHVHQVHANPSATRLQVETSRWLLLAPLPQAQQGELLLLPELEGNTVLWWSGGTLRSDLVQQIRPQVAIAYGRRLHAQTAEALKKQGSQVYWLQRDGAVQWSSRRGMRTMVGAELAAL